MALKAHVHSFCVSQLKMRTCIVFIHSFKRSKCLLFSIAINQHGSVSVRYIAIICSVTDLFNFFYMVANFLIASVCMYVCMSAVSSYCRLYGNLLFYWFICLDLTKGNTVMLDCKLEMTLLPPRGNFADIFYLKEQSVLHRMRDDCTLKHVA